MEKKLYLYCAVNKRSEESFGCIGFLQEEVYAMPYKGLSVIVQLCSLKELRDKPQAELAINHQYVIDLMMKEFEEVIPFSPSTVIKSRENLNKLLSLKYQKIKSELQAKKDKREYGIQIFYSPPYLQEKPNALSSIKSFILGQKQKRNDSIKGEDEFKAELLKELKALTEEIKVNHAFMAGFEGWKDRKILLNLSCLVHKDKVKKLEEKLAEINGRKEFSVNFNGPWAPYSFTKIIEE